MGSNSKRSTTGIKGLDFILGGGLPRDKFYLVQGNPGVGKTTLALQFLLEGAQAGETGLYFTLSETKTELQVIAASHNWSLESVHIFELSNIEKELSGENQNTVFHPSELELNQTINVLLQQVERIKPARIVFDSLSEMRLLAQSALRYRRELLSLKHYFAGLNSTVLLLDDLTSETGDLQVQSIAHGVILLSKVLSDYGTVRHELEILKVRGVKFQLGRHDYLINTGGVEVFPRLVAAAHRTEFKKQSFSSGLPGLDAMLGGGLDRGTSSVFMGPAGAGKSTLALSFVAEAARRGETAAIFAFDENIGLSLNRSVALGADFSSAISNGTVYCEQVDPAEQSAGELAWKIKQLVEERQLKLLVIDSMNGYLNAMPGERTLLLHLHELLSYLSNCGVITILTLAQHGLIGYMETPIDLTYLGDTVLLMRFFEYEGSIRKAISVVKKRSGTHESQIREFKTGNGKIDVGGQLNSFQGILTGTPSMRLTKVQNNVEQ